MTDERKDEHKKNEHEQKHDNQPLSTPNEPKKDESEKGMPTQATK